MIKHRFYSNTKQHQQQPMMSPFAAALITAFLLILAVLFLSGEMSPLHENNSLAVIERKRRERQERHESQIAQRQQKVVSPADRILNPLSTFLRCSAHDRQMNQPINVAFFGDSNSKGLFLNEMNIWTSKPEQSFPFLLLSANPTNIDLVGDAEKSLEERNIVAVGTSGLVGDKIIPFTKSKEFLGAKTKFEVSKNLDVAFVMFGTNDALKRNKEIADDKEIYTAYRNFFENEILNNFRARRVVVITPPPVLKSCPKIPFCLLVNQNVFKHQIIQQMRLVGLDLEKSTKGRVKLVDFFGKLNSLTTVEKKNTTSFTLSDEEARMRPYFQADGVHLSRKGHEALVELLKEEGCK